MSMTIDSFEINGSHPEIYYWDGGCCPTCDRTFSYVEFHPFALIPSQGRLGITSTKSNISVAMLTKTLNQSYRIGIGYLISGSEEVCGRAGFGPAFLFCIGDESLKQ